MSAIISSLVLIFCVSSLEFIDKAESSLLGEEKQCSSCPTCTPCSSCPVLSSQSCDNCQPRSENTIPVKNPEHRTVAFENEGDRRRGKRFLFPIWKPSHSNYPKKCSPCPVKECKKCKKCPRKTKCKKCKCKCRCKHRYHHHTHGDPSPYLMQV
ncbi:uncharacterized protein [Parasteatoda tepidariorum]|uniref:uncharacterized protein isoform X1 n=1 Tax=Parasteatoda tepidariorum TaxID=114398 RepID=UPI001C718889|nr:uncharacterized protein LOC107449826 [Parasteatoda tepidariorum]